MLPTLLVRPASRSLMTSSRTAGWQWLLPLVVLLLSGPGSAWAQTLINETFETGNSFTVVNGTQTNKWFVGTVAGNGLTTAGTQAAYISDDAAGTTYNYGGALSVVHLYRDITFPAGQTVNQLSFDWKGQGESSFDYMQVFVVPISTTPVAGTQLASGQVGNTYYNQQGATYTRSTINLPVSVAGTTQRVVFSWRNDASVYNQPPAALDNVTLLSRAAAPLNGAYTINNTQPTAGTNFNNFTDAITSLNTDGIVGAVTFNVSAGQTFAENPPAITATGTAANPISFQKTTGTNPVVQATSGAAAAIDLAGGDYFTFNGIDVAAGATGPTYGYRIRNASATDGAFNNTVQNANITLLRTTSTSGVGLIQTSNSVGGGVAATASSGVNQNNRYLNLTVRNAYSGIWLVGTSTSFADFNTEVANCAVGNPAVLGDIGNGNGTTASTAYGIRSVLQNQQSIHDNVVTNVYAATTVYGISIEQSFSTGTTAGRVFNNRVSGVRNNSTSSTSVAYGMRADVANITGQVLSVYNNFISNITNGYTGTATVTRIVRGIYLQSAGTGTGCTINLQYNSVRIDGSGSPNGSNTCFEIGTSSGPIYDVRDNIFANFTTGQTSAQGKHYTWVSSSSTAIGATGTVSDYNDLYVASGTGDTPRGYVGAQGTIVLTAASTVDRPTLIEWRTAPVKDVNSVSVDPLFVSPTDLHAQAAGINNLATPIAGITTDIDGQPRGIGAAGSATGPDIGADEFTPPTCLAATNLGAGNITATSADITFTPAAGGSTYTITYTPQGGTTTTFTSTATGSPVTVTGLAGTTFYTVGVTTNCGGGLTSATPTVSFTTLAGCAPVTALAASGVTTTTANLTFTAGNGNTSYTVTYTPAGGTATTVSPAPTASPVALTGLMPGTSYSATVQPLCSGGGTAAASTVAFTTPATPPANDQCSGAIALTCGQTVTGTTTGATTTGDPTGTCGPTVSAQGGVFYSFTGTGDIVTVSTCSGPTATTGDTKLFVFSGACGALTCVAGNDDATTANCGTNSLASLVTFTSVAGTNYVIFVQGFNSALNFGLSLTCAAPPSCAPITGLTAASITATTANLTFTAGNGNTSYTVTYTPAGGATTTVSPAPTASPVALTGLAPGTAYSATVQPLCSGGGTAAASTISFTTLFAPPANDDCSGAIALTSATTCAPTSGTVAGATQSLAPILCNGFTSAGPAQDVFYSFTATGTTHTIAVTGTFDGVLEVLSGACGATANVGCSDVTGNNETLTLSTLTAGTTYLVRYYPYSANPTNKTFTICVTNPAACAAPTAVATNTVTSTTANVTFTAGNGNTGYTVNYTPAGGTTQTATGTASPVALTGLTPGTTYSVTVTGNCAAGATATSSPAVSFTTLFPAPANDECSGAIALTSATTCAPTAGSTLGATASAGITGTCAGTADDDVFYSFVATNTTHTVTVAGNAGFDAVVNLRAGACPGVQVGSCQDANVAGGTEVLTATGLTVGATYLVRVYSYSATPPSSAATGGFTICVTNPAPVCNAPTALTATSITQTTANASFTAGTGNTGFIATATPQGGGTAVTSTGTASPIALTGLAPGTAYNLSLQAMCSGGGTTPAVTATFTTLPCTAPTAAFDNTNASAVCAGSGTTLTGTLTGTAPFTGQYTVNGGPAQTLSTTGNTFSIATGPLTANATYTITALADATCTATTFPAPATVTANPLPTFTTAQTNVNCFGGNDGTITVTAAAGTGTFEYSKNGGTSYQASNVFSGLAAGTYQVRVRNQGGTQCAAPAQAVTITQPGSAVSFTTSQTNVGCFGGSTGSLTVTASGGTVGSGYQYSNNNGTSYQASNVFSGLAAGTYQVRVRDGNACVAPAQAVTITQPNSALAVSATKTDATSFGATDGTVTATGANGTSPYQYSLNGGAFSPATPTAGPFTFTSLSAGNYSVTVRDANACTAATNITVSSPGAPVCNAPTALTATGVTQTSANASFTAGTGNTSFTATATPATGPVVSNTGTASPIALTGLAPNTAYTLSLQAVCSAGGTTPAVTATFSTPATTCAAPGTPGFSAITTTSASVSFTPSSTNVGPYTVTATAGASTITATGAGSPINLTGLASGTTYSVTVTGTCTTAAGGGTSPASAAASFTTTTPPCNAPTAPTAGSVTNNSATVSFTGSASAVNGYTVTTTPVTTTQMLAAGATSVSFAGLSASTAYSVSIVSNCAGGATSGAAIAMFTTTANPVCSAPSITSVSGVTQTTASVNLTPGANGGTTYTVTATPTAGAPITATGTSPVSLTGLTAGTSYSVTATSTCNAGFSSPSPASAATTFTTTAATPNPLIAVSQGGTGIANGGSFSGFASTQVGSTSAAVVFTITNASSSSALTLGTFALTGPFALSGAQPTSVAANSSATFSLTFTPTGTGANPGTLTIPNNSLSNSTYVINLSGQGTPAPLPNLIVTGGTQNVSGAYNNVTVTGTGRANLVGALSVSGALVIEPSGVLSQNCQLIDGPGSFEVQAGALLGICDPAGLYTTGALGAVRVTGTRTYSSGAAYAYNNPAVAQVTGPGLPAQVNGLGVNNPAGVTLSQAVAVAQQLTLQAGNLNTGGRLFTLLSSATGTAVVDNGTAGSVVNGTTTVQRFIDNANPIGYRHYSAPVSNTFISDLAAPGLALVLTQAYNTSPTPGLVTPFPNVFGYNESRVNSVTSNYPTFDKGWFTPQSGDAMVVNRGYTVNAPNTALVDFVGLLNNGQQNSGALAYSGPNAGWHLLGNPYPAPLDWNTVLPAQRLGMEPGMSVFQSSGQYGGSYRTFGNGIGASSLIVGASGYLVRVNTVNGAGAVNLTNGNRLTTFGAQPAFGRGTADTRPQLQLLLRGATARDETYVYFQAGASAGHDADYDVSKPFNPSGLNVNSLAGGDDLAINGLPLLSTAPVLVPLAVATPSAGSYSFEAGNVANFTGSVTLIDALANTRTVLASGTRYAFTLAGTAAPGRFTLEFRSTGALATTSAQALAAQIQLFPNPTSASFRLQLPVLVGQAVVPATLVNALGQVVLSRTLRAPAGQAIDALFDVRGLATGVYTLHLNVAGTPLVRKVVVE